MRWLHHDVAENYTPNRCQAYIDDVDFIARSADEFQTLSDRTEQFMETAGMQVKHRKCAVLQGQRTGNNWKQLDNIDVQIQDGTIPVLPREQS